ncbi:MAG: ATP-binding cassette domain-containing protein [Lutibacter sp.]|uniref:ABC transporter ATP-binding protein n=1 Tax=Lutibacter sp. TaxID=1925666 RepID=UPI0017BF4FD2|nr:ABC transporter ATP-binding protein [Lutibacter sp.]MBT8317138.1 ATP-binding cassette domain-containing protein [Lutibacter sp.]NNJ57998.1 ATP-binding cassette domain-containing protein [Lutibacter sp.]
MKNILTVDSVCKNYGNFTALNNVSISVPEGSVFGLLGPNGAGKTSLIRIINQITLPDSGTIFLDGEPLQPHHIQNIGYLPEERGLYKSMKVGEQVLYLAQLKGMSKTEAKKKLQYWFEKFEITDWWDKKIQELSKGMAQKVQFIVTVLHEPKLLIFDEPFSGFDPINANLIKDEILKLRDEGASIIFSTHRMESVEELCDHIALINKSNKILDGKLNDIKQEYRTNQFEVGLLSDQKDELFKVINSKFTVEESKLSSFNTDLRLLISLKKGETSTEMIQFLNSNAQITHFTEVIPSVNDIFLKSVANNG